MIDTYSTRPAIPSSDRAEIFDCLHRLSLDELMAARRLILAELDRRTGKRKFQLPAHVEKMLD